MKIPLEGEVIAVVRRHSEIASAYRLVKDMLQLSDAFCDYIGGLAVGHTNKCLGPTGTKNIGPVPFDIFNELMAVEWHLVINPEAVKRMESRWEQRNEERIRIESRRPSKVILERAKPYVIRQLGRSGGLKSASQPSHRLASSKGGKSRMKKLSKRERRELGKKAADARWAKSKASALTVPAE